MEEILSEAEETFERKYAMSRRGYDLDKVAKRAAAVCAVEANDIFSRNKQPARVKARSLFCYWASSELGITYTELSRRIGISAPGGRLQRRKRQNYCARKRLSVTGINRNLVF